MAYFANSSEGVCFEEECANCIFGKKYCPIFYVQFDYNYEACNNKTAREILDHLVSNNGECALLREYPEIFKIKQ